MIRIKFKGDSMDINIGINESDRKEIAHGLSKLLADSFVLYMKTHSFHWNVKGPMFASLHLLFEEQYTEQWNALDEIAERIRMLGETAPGTFKEFQELSSIAETTKALEAPEMIAQLVEGHESVIRTARNIFDFLDKVHDEPTADLITQRVAQHEKNAWMLRSLLE
jgi:starvation-inducible DNA-binding protein